MKKCIKNKIFKHIHVQCKILMQYYFVSVILHRYHDVTIKTSFMLICLLQTKVNIANQNNCIDNVTRRIHVLYTYRPYTSRPFPNVDMNGAHMGTHNDVVMNIRNRKWYYIYLNIRNRIWYFI